MKIDKRRLAANFDAVAAHYESEAVLQRTVSSRLLERLEYLLIKPERILDLGSGTGLGARSLARNYSGVDLTQLDLSRQMLLQSRAQKKMFQKKQAYVCADQESLPFKDDVFDLIFSSLSVQWSENFSQTAKEITRILRPDGLFVFSSLGPGTLSELKSSWEKIDDSTHVNDFHDIRQLGDMLIESGLSDPVLDSEVITLTYNSCMDLLKDLKRTGVANVSLERRKTLTGKFRLAKLGKSYESFRSEGKLPSSYEVIYGHAWGCATTKYEAEKKLNFIDMQTLKARQDV